MGLWGVTPVFVTALLGATTGSHPALLHNVAEHSVVRVVSTSPSPELAPIPDVLRETSAGEWQATVVVDGVPGGCATGEPKKSNYDLQTTVPDKTLKPTSAINLTDAVGSPVSGVVAISAHPVSPAQQAVATSALSVAASGPSEVSCEVTLDFSGLAQVPETATLFVDGSSSVQLTVSRDVTLFQYLAIPAISGSVMAFLLLILCILFVRVPDFSGRGERLLSRVSWKRPLSRVSWNFPVSASAAWTLNDSWATNITLVAAAIGSIYGITTAANSIFPGVALNRFAILVAFAGVIAAVAPLFFGIMYSLWNYRHPGAEFRFRLSLRDRPEGGHVAQVEARNELTGTFRMVILTALVTIFGIGAEIGIGAVLAIQMSDATTAGHWVAGVIAVAIAIFTLCYSVLAICTIADPEPGSSLSSPGGTSFTL
jgi:hypothetical protein